MSSGLDPEAVHLGVLLIVDFGVVSTYNHITEAATYILLDKPYVIVGPIGLIVAVVGIRYLDVNYAEAVQDLHFHKTEEPSLKCRCRGYLTRHPDPDHRRVVPATKYRCHQKFLRVFRRLASLRTESA